MRKIVINKCFGGFGISLKAAEYMAARGHAQAQAEIKKYEEAQASNLPGSIYGHWHGYGYVEGFSDGYKRDDPLLVEAVEKLGEDADGMCAELKAVEVPDDAEWEIEEYDGKEWIAEKHRSWS